MKRIFVILISLVFSVCTLVGCGKENDCVKMKYYLKAEEMIPLLKSGNLEYGILPEPALTNLKKISDGKEWFSLSLQELYSEEEAYPQAVMLVKESILSTYPSIAEYLQNTFDSGKNWVKSNSSLAVDKVNACLEEGLTPSLKNNLEGQTVENCNIFYQDAESAKESVKNYLSELIELDQKSANQVGEDFFYNGRVEEKINGQEKIKVVCPDGAPALAIAKYINDNDSLGTGKEVEYKIVSSDKVGSYVISASGDIVILPVNAASKIYKANANEKYKMVSVVTHGNLYLVSKEKIELSDLKNKKVGVIGQGLVPDLTFKTILKNNNIDFEIAE